MAHTKKEIWTTVIRPKFFIHQDSIDQTNS